MINPTKFVNDKMLHIHVVEDYVVQDSNCSKVDIFDHVPETKSTTWL